MRVTAGAHADPDPEPTTSPGSGGGIAVEALAAAQMVLATADRRGGRAVLSEARALARDLGS